MIKRPWRERLAILRDEYGVQLAPVAKALGVNRVTLWRWIKSDKEPQIWNMRTIEKHLTETERRCKRRNHE